MNELQNLKRQLMPMLKGLPFIIVMFVLALFIANRFVSYTVPRYKATARIKLDDQSVGISNNNLYQDFDVFSTTNKIESEVEVLKSPLLVGLALNRINRPVSCYRVGSVRKTLLYNDCPFAFQLDSISPRYYDQPIAMIVDRTGHFTLQPEHGAAVAGQLGVPVQASGMGLTMSLNDSLLALRDLVWNDTYEVQFHTRDAQISSITSKFLEVAPIDKEVAVVRINYQDESPQRAADIVNALSEAYINDYVSTKSQAAQKTLEFIDERLVQIEKDLAESEWELERYKLKNRVVNTVQETETDLRKLSDLKVQEINLSMSEESLSELEGYINSGSYFDKVAPQFGYGDLLFTELVKRLKQLADERRDLLLKYTPESPEALVNDEKIGEIKHYIAEGIASARRELEVKKAGLAESIASADAEFIKYPARERQLKILERNFHLNDAAYNFLSTKRMEANIAASALISFHRIIQRGVPAREPVAPNKVLILFVAGLAALIVSIGLVYLRTLANGKIRHREELEKHSSVPVAGILKHHRNTEASSEDFAALANQWLLTRSHNEPALLQITSPMRNEGKSYTARQLATAFAEMGYTTALVNADLRNSAQAGPGLSDFLAGTSTLDDVVQPESPMGLFSIGAGRAGKNAVQVFGNKHVQARLAAVRARFDITVIDSPATAIAPESIRLMQYVDSCLFVLRAGKTPRSYLGYADLLCEEYGFDHLQLALNGVHQAFNHDGRYAGSRYSYSAPTTGWFRLLPHYLKTYMR